MSDDNNSDSDSVWMGLLPKRETQAMSFLGAHADCDGRGVVVGILDTGVDPGGVGLQTTSDGRPKVIDVIDCSGSGDVKMYGPMAAETGPEGGPSRLRAKSGRELLLNSAWQNPTGEWFVGSKIAYELYPKSLLKRVRAARREMWLKTHRQCEMDAMRAAVTATSDEEEEWAARVAQLKALAATDEDPGPVLDCVLFHDGSAWQACVDTTGEGDLSACSPMEEYKVHRQFARLSEDDALNYCFNILPGEGGAGEHRHTLVIVVDAGAHGSHVAGIVAAHHPDQPERNGVAPGAQIVSLKIGDSHLGSMETGTALMRALVAATRCGCHVLNMSYGEAVDVPDDGEFTRLLDSLVYDHGILFVSSAGNNGPALSTVGAPGGTSSSTISVAAFATQSLMKAAYSMTEMVRPTNYTWSSVGPSTDGHSGVTLMAPGGAVTCVSNWTLDKSMLMNGTSMSSPNACGCIALLLSGIRAHPEQLGGGCGLFPSAIASPHRVRHALHNSCQWVSGVDALGQGHGLIQVSAAWEHLVSHAAVPELDYTLSVQVLSSAFKRGIYLRHPSEVSRREVYKVCVKPVFPELATVDTKLSFEWKLRLECPAAWVNCPEYVILAQSGKTFSVEVDPRMLEEGMHVSSVKGYLVNHPEAGVVVEVPITVLKPQTVSGYVPEAETDGSLSLGTLSLEQGERFRKFIVPPVGCTYIDALICDSRHAPREGGEAQDRVEGDDDRCPDGSGGDASARLLVLHAVQIMTGSAYCKHEKQAYLNMLPGSRHVVSWPVEGGCPLEIVLARNWSSVGDADVSCSATLHFCGVLPSPTRLVLQGGSAVSPQVRVTSHLASVDCSPSSKLDKWVAAVWPLSASKADGGAVKPTWPGLNKVLYESAFVAQFYTIFDVVDQRVVATGDAWPTVTKLVKGQYGVTLHVRATSVDMLQNITTLQMLLERDLSKAIPLSFYATQTGAMSGTAKAGTVNLKPGTSTVYYVKDLQADQVPKSASPGDWLTGSVTYLKKSNGHAGAGARPGGFPVAYTISSGVESTKMPKEAAEVEPDVTRETDQSAQVGEKAAKNFNKAMREAKVKYLKGMTGTDTFMPLVALLVAEDRTIEDDLAFQQALLENAEATALRSSERQDYEGVVAAADRVVALIDSTAIALNLGQLVNKENKDAVGARKETERRKFDLVNALCCKISALMKLKDSSGETTSFQEAFNSACDELLKWDDLSAQRFAMIRLTLLQDKKRFGLMIKSIRDLLTQPIDTSATTLSRDDLMSMLEMCARNLGWVHVMADMRAARAALSAFPSQK